MRLALRRVMSSKAHMVIIAGTLAWLAFAYALVAVAVRLGGRDAATLGMVLTGKASVSAFMLAFACATILLLFLVRSERGSRLLEGAFLVAVFAGIWSLAAALLSPSTAVLVTAFCVFVYYASTSVWTFDALLAMGCAGIAANLGSAMRPVGVVTVLAVLIAYDLASIYVTKHTVVTAERLLRRRVFFAMILPERPAGYMLPASEAAPSAGFTFLGTGDVILPAILVANAAVSGALAAALTAFGALAGTALLHLLYLSQPERKPMPALPPIAAGAMIGYLLASFLG